MRIASAFSSAKPRARRPSGARCQVRRVGLSYSPGHSVHSLVCWVVAGKIVATYTTTDGTPKTNLLLISGWWGLSRHFHYMPELGAALCWGLPALFQGAMPYATCRRRRAWGFRCVLTRLLDARYFYFLFLLPLLVDRASRDDQRCSLKYGKAWDEYRRIVPYKIVPGVY